MKKLAAHYLLTDTGLLIKNGIAVLGDNASVVKFIDPRGELRETQQMIFHSGLLLCPYELVKTFPRQVVSSPVDTFQFQVLEAVKDSNHLSMTQLVDLGKLLQEQFKQMNVPQILENILDVLLSKAGYEKRPLAGICLLSGLDLALLHFTSKSRIKKIT